MRILLIGNSGGHFEQLKQLKGLEKKYEIFYVTNKNTSNQSSKLINYFIRSPHGRNKMETMAGYTINFIEALFILIRVRPNIIISTGAGIAVPIIMIGKFLKIKIIFIESFARVDKPSRTGKFVYKYCDTFIVQHRKLCDEFPNAIYGGWIY